MTTYDTIIEMFTSKISEYDWFNKTDVEKDEIIEKYMVSTCAKFRTCQIDLSDRDDVLRQFNNDLTDEIIDIIVTGMITEWIKPKLYNSDNLKSFLNTKDFNIAYKPQTLTQIRETYNECRLEFKSMVRNYSYNHNDINEVIF